ncbi:MAG: UbiA family prenyltransferase [Chloroflexi bacterium]|nr:UbiA family prenyltransferase [Chloroflexota bacterium]
MILHLRLHWQVLLSPLFLWGFLLSGGEMSTRLWVVLLIFHVLFYGGATALNSYYDQDEGPIGGLWNPPQVTRDLLVFSVTVQAVGLVLIWFISRPLFVLSLVMGVVGNAYSHPAIRLKSHPWSSLLAVSIFQGMGGTAAGWLCGQADWTTLFSVKAMMGMLAASLIITGFYPLTQIYQREEDRRRGDITFAVQWGERCFPLAILCLLLTAVLMGFLIWRDFGPWESFTVVGGLIVLAGLVYFWWRRFDASRMRENYVQMMRIGYIMTGGFLSFIGFQLIRGF